MNARTTLKVEPVRHECGRARLLSQTRFARTLLRVTLPVKAADHEYGRARFCMSNRLTSRVVCPLAARVAGEFVFELQSFVEGMSFDQLASLAVSRPNLS
jgi:hypothetical protein